MGKAGFSVLDKEAEVFEFNGEIYVVDDDFLGDLKYEWSKVEDAINAGINQVICDFLRGGGGHGGGGGRRDRAGDGGYR